MSIKKFYLDVVESGLIFLGSELIQIGYELIDSVKKDKPIDFNFYANRINSVLQPIKDINEVMKKHSEGEKNA